MHANYEMHVTISTSLDKQITVQGLHSALWLYCKNLVSLRMIGQFTKVIHDPGIRSLPSRRDTFGEVIVIGLAVRWVYR